MIKIVCPVEKKQGENNPHVPIDKLVGVLLRNEKNVTEKELEHVKSCKYCQSKLLAAMAAY